LKLFLEISKKFQESFFISKDTPYICNVNQLNKT
jgi:hypothetical protein